MIGKHLNGLASAASRYQKVLEENRKLYNQVQDLKGRFMLSCILIDLVRDSFGMVMLGFCECI